ncbi:retrovirus-related pol polyprotein from transposon TNT 1-94 [Tanacetum coccineum]
MKTTGRTFTIVGNSYPLTRITSANIVPPKKTISHSVETQKPELKVYSMKPKNGKKVDIPSSSSLVMTGTVRFGNKNISRIMGYGDYQLGNVTISRVYYVEGLGHNLFSVGQFCDADLEVAFQKNTCFICNLEDVDLLFGSPCALGKSKKSSHQPKAKDTNQEKLYLLHMDLCGPIRVASINGKRNILVIVDDYSRFTCVRFLRTKDKAPEAIIKCLKNIQVRLNATVHNLNGVVESELNSVDDAHSWLIFSKAPLFLWAEAINTACYTQNRSIIRRRYNKTPYELMQDKKSDLSFFHVFGALCYPTNDNDDLGKLGAKADIGIFIGCAPAIASVPKLQKKKPIFIETIHVTFNELTAMAFEQFSSGPGLHFRTPATSGSGLVPNTISQQPCIPPNRD